MSLTLRPKKIMCVSPNPTNPSSDPPTLGGSCSIVVQCLPGMREVLGSNPLRGNILCSPSPSEETINRSPNTSIPTTHALICEELKDPDLPTLFFFKCVTGNTHIFFLPNVSKHWSTILTHYLSDTLPVQAFWYICCSSTTCWINLSAKPVSLQTIKLFIP